jgi:hypothetical protein
VFGSSVNISQARPWLRVSGFWNGRLRGYNPYKFRDLVLVGDQ